MSAAGEGAGAVASPSPAPASGPARERFVRETLAQRVVFGAGAAATVAAEVQRLERGRVLLVTTPGGADGQAAQVADALGGLLAERFPEAAMHTPVEVTERAQRRVIAKRADAVVSVGGGSAVGLGKALAVREGLAHLAVPTTYAGSEMTPVLGETRDGVKRTRRDAAILPRTVVYDPLLTHGLPPALSATSGLNAIAHAVEALYAADGDPLVDLFAREGIAALARGLRAVVADPADAAARADALYGAWLCASCLAAVPMGLHHQICHVLGGSFDLPHSETHAVVLPHVAAYNAAAAPDALAQVAAALGGVASAPRAASAPADAVAHAAAPALADLADALGVPRTLRQLGLGEAAIEPVVAQVLSRPYPNPRSPDAEGLRTLLRAALDGTEPR